jgi:hypothetical protein
MDNTDNMKIKNIVFFLILLVEISISIPLGWKLYTVKSPPHQFADYLNRNYPNNQIFVVSGFRWEEKHLSYYIGEERVVVVGKSHAANILELKEKHPRGEIIIKLEEGDDIPRMEDVQVGDCRVFERDKRIHYKHNSVEVCFIDLKSSD